MARLFALLVLIVAAPTSALAGEVDYPSLGVSFTYPDVWQVSESGDFLVLTSHSEIGLAVLTVNEATDVTQLKASADEGIFDEGVSLRRSGNFQKVGIEGLGAEFSGTFQGTPAKAFVAGVINPFGKGVTIIALTTNEAYGSKQVALVNTLAQGLNFAEPKDSEHTLEWRRDLPGHRLTYLDTRGGSGAGYTDSSGTSYSTYSGYSSRRTIDFCSNKRFFAYGSSSASFDSGAGFGATSGQGGGDGEWSVSTGGDGKTLLTLKFDDGDVREAGLSYENEKTRLDGDHYFYTESDVCR
jgi:hypothetical protein